MPATSPEALARRRERERERDRERRAHDRERRRVRFVAIDGESVHHAGRGHAYCLMAASTGESLVNRDGAPLATNEILRWLVALHRRHAPCQMVWYYGDFDTNNIVRDIGRASWDLVKDLYAGRQVEWRDDGTVYVLKYIPTKALEIGVRAGNGRLSPWLAIHDVRGWIDGGLFGGARQWGYAIDQTDADIVAGHKQRRGAFVPGDVPALAQYCAKECSILAGIMERVRDALLTLNLRPQQWYGPGRAAADLMRRHAIGDQVTTLPPKIDAAALASYYGGRVQAPIIGLVGEAIQYDIRSAYPWALAQVPTMRGRWQAAPAYDPRAPWSVWRVVWDIPDEVPCYVPPFPFRGAGGEIFYPRNGEGWYWAPEIAAALRLYGAYITVYEGWVFYPADDGRPFAWMRDAYLYRRRLESRSPALAGATKRVINAVYGKLAQGSTYTGARPPFQSFFWAGLATSLVRARILDAAAPNPGAIVVIQTDSLVSVDPLPLDIGGGLGQWREVARGDTFALSSGVFQMAGRGVVRSKMRGIAHQSAAASDWDLMRWLWMRDGFAMSYRIPLRLFVGMGVAIARRTPGVWRAWLEREVRVSTAPTRWQPRPYREHAWRLDPVAIETLAPNPVSRSYIVKGGSLTDPELLDTAEDQGWEREQPAPIYAEDYRR